MPFTYEFTYMHVLEIQMMSGGLIGCIVCISFSTVVVYMFNYMTCPKCSVCIPLCFSGAFYSLLKCFPSVFITENQKTDGLGEQGKTTLRLLWKTRDVLFKIVIKW